MRRATLRKGPELSAKNLAINHSLDDECACRTDMGVGNGACNGAIPILLGAGDFVAHVTKHDATSPT